MTEDEAVDLVYEGLAGLESLPVKLRGGLGLDREQLSRTKDAIEYLVQCYQGQDSVPKRLAAAFVDLQAAMEWGRGSYPEAEQDEIEDASIALAELAWELFDTPPVR